MLAWSSLVLNFRVRRLVMIRGPVPGLPRGKNVVETRTCIVMLWLRVWRNVLTSGAQVELTLQKVRLREICVELTILTIVLTLLLGRTLPRATRLAGLVLLGHLAVVGVATAGVGADAVLSFDFLLYVVRAVTVMAVVVVCYRSSCCTLGAAAGGGGSGVG